MEACPKSSMAKIHSFVEVKKVGTNYLIATSVRAFAMRVVEKLARDIRVFSGGVLILNSHRIALK